MSEWPSSPIPNPSTKIKADDISRNAPIPLPSPQPAGGDKAAEQLKELLQAEKLRRQRQNNIEKYLGPLSYLPNERIWFRARLSDNLLSIAASHPALGDVLLWRLLARCNGLSTEVDIYGVPKATLERGVSLLLPTLSEIADYRKLLQASSSVNAPKNALKTTISNSRLPAMNIDQAKEFSQMAQKGLVDLEPDWSQITISSNCIKALDDSCRIVKFTVQEKGISKSILQLEVFNSVWLPILTYKISANASVRNQYQLDGTWDSFPIDLPAEAVPELVLNDLQANWRDYCNQFLP